MISRSVMFCLTSELFPLTFPFWAFFICSWYCSMSKADRTYNFLTRKGLVLFFASSSAIFKHLKNMGRHSLIKLYLYNHFWNLIFNKKKNSRMEHKYHPLMINILKPIFFSLAYKDSVLSLAFSHGVTTHNNFRK